MVPVVKVVRHDYATTYASVAPQAFRQTERLCFAFN